MKKNTLPTILFCLLASMSMAQTFTPIDINAGTDGSTPYSQTSFQGKVYFRASTPATGSELWVSDGTTAGTQMLKDIVPGPGSSYPSYFIECNNELFFVANDSVHGSELWVTDGTSAGTQMIADVMPGTTSSNPSYMTSFNNKLYFSATDATHGQELWVSDGTTGGTSLLKDINPGTDPGSPEGYAGNSQKGIVFHFNDFNGVLYFRANDGVHGTELWKTDGTSAGTTMVKDLLPGPNGGRSYCMFPLGTQMLMGATDSIHGYELWITDGTDAGTQLLKDIDPGISGSEPASYSGFTLFNNKVYFMAGQATTGNELWVTDGTSAGTTLVKDILPGPGSAAPGQLGMIVFNNHLYFAANDSVNGSQLWTSDGTSAGTSLVKVLSNIAGSSSSPRAFVSYNSQLIFVGEQTNSFDPQLWTSDGTAANTHVIAPAVAPNLAPLSSNSNGYAMCWNNGSLFFTANFNSIGDELWVYNTPSTAIVEVDASSALSAYPNPFHDVISLTGLNKDDQYRVYVRDISGREVYNSMLPSGEQADINLAHISAGIYTIQLSGKAAQQTFKMVKQ